MSDRKRVLFLTSQFPHSADPHSAPFTTQRLGHISKLCDVVVVAPVFWYPFKRYRYHGRPVRGVFRTEKIGDLTVYHPRALYIPKILRAAYGFLYFASVYPICSRLSRTFKYDAIYAIWAYPDGFAASLLSRLFKKPLIIKVLGSDINVTFKYYLRRKMILYALKESARILSVSRSLKKIIVANGIPENKVTVLYNGVDTKRFSPVPKAEARIRLDLPAGGKAVIYIGHLLKAKGVQYLIDAFRRMGDLDCRLVILGNGPDRRYFERRIRGSGLDGKVAIIDECSHEQVPLWINSSDLLCLPSLREGLPNVVMEAIACGRPVVATDLDGTREIFRGGEIFGRLVPVKDPAALSLAIKETLSAEWNVEDMLDLAKRYSWTKNAELLLKHIMAVTS